MGKKMVKDEDSNEIEITLEDLDGSDVSDFEKLPLTCIGMHQDRLHKPLLSNWFRRS